MSQRKNHRIITNRKGQRIDYIALDTIFYCPTQWVQKCAHYLSLIRLLSKEAFTALSSPVSSLNKGCLPTYWRQKIWLVPASLPANDCIDIASCSRWYTRLYYCCWGYSGVFRHGLHLLFSNALQVIFQKIYPTSLKLYYYKYFFMSNFFYLFYWLHSDIILKLTILSF